jgi:hypothetical protein
MLSLKGDFVEAAPAGARLTTCSLQTRQMKKTAPADGDWNHEMNKKEGEDEDLDDDDEGGDEEDAKYREHAYSNNKTISSKF